MARVSSEAAQRRGARALSSRGGVGATTTTMAHLPAPHFQSISAEQKTMCDGAHARLRTYRRMLRGGELANDLRGRFWDVVVLTAANARQAAVYDAQLDRLHARGQLPGDRATYLVVADPPGARVGSGGATLHVMLKLQASTDDAWTRGRILLLHAGGYSERSPAHGTLGKAFGQLPMDAADVGVPATILEAQLVNFVDLVTQLPPGVFVSSADVALQFGDTPALSDETREKASWGILALGHVGDLKTGEQHGVFACDRESLRAFAAEATAAEEEKEKEKDAAADAAPAAVPPPVAPVVPVVTERAASVKAATFAKAAAARAAAAAAEGVAIEEPRGPRKVAALECVRCLQKPSSSTMHASGAVMPSPSSMGFRGGGGPEWVLTDSAFHIGYRACDALVRCAASNPGVFAGVEVCAYGDFMQCLGTDPDDSYRARIDHVASIASGVTGTVAAAAAADGGGVQATRLRAAREALAKTLKGAPLLVVPVLPSRFVHVGTLPELLHHSVADGDVLAALPAAHQGVSLGTWDVAMMNGIGGGGGGGGGGGRKVSRLSVGADGVWGAGKGAGPSACELASFVSRGARIGPKSLVAHCDVGALATIGAGCLLHDVDVPRGAVVPNGCFLHAVPLRAAAATGAGIEVAPGTFGDDGAGASCWTCIVLDVHDEVKKPGKSTLCGVPVVDAASRLGLDPGPGASVWTEDEPRTTTTARVFPVCASAMEATEAALRVWGTIKGGGASEGTAPDVATLRVSIGEALRTLADHAAAAGRRDRLRARVVGAAIRQMLTRDTPVERWIERAPPLRAVRAEMDGSDVDAAVRRALALTRSAVDPNRASAAAAAATAAAGNDGGERLDRQTVLDASRVALALAAGDDVDPAAKAAAEGAAARFLRAAVCAPFASSGVLFGRGGVDASAARELPPPPTTTAISSGRAAHGVRVEYPARLNLAGGWTDTPPYSLERNGAVLHVAVLTAAAAAPAAAPAAAAAPAETAAGSEEPTADVNADADATATDAAKIDADADGGVVGRPIRVVAARLPGKPGIVRFTTEPGLGDGSEGPSSEEIRTVDALLEHDDPTLPFALHRACVALALVPHDAAAGRIDDATTTTTTTTTRRKKPKLASVIDGFLGASGFGLEIRTRVDLPRGSGLGTSSILALAVMHALHELSTGCEWKPNGREDDEDDESDAFLASVFAATTATTTSTTAAAAETRPRWAGRSVLVSPPSGSSPGETSIESYVEASDEPDESDAFLMSVLGGAGRPVVEWPASRVAFNAVLAVEAMMTTGGGWQDQVGGAMEGARLSTSTPGAARGIDALDSLPQYESRVASTPAACAAFVSRRVVVVFTGAVRLAKAVTSSVVDGWRRRAVDVEACLKACVAIAGEMASSLDALGALPSSSFVGAGSEAANAGIEKLADALERHKKIQEKLWPAITSAPVKALYDAIAPLCLGSHICGAGNGGHVIAFLRPGASAAAAAAAAAACAEAPNARVVRVEMLLGGGGGGGVGGAGGK